MRSAHPYGLRPGPRGHRARAPLERLPAVPLGRPGREAPARATRGGGGGAHDLSHAPGGRAPRRAVRPRRQARVGAARLDRRRGGADPEAAGTRLGRGARPRRRGGPPAGAPARLPPGAGTPGHGSARDPVAPHRRRSKAPGARARGSRPARPHGSRASRYRRDGAVPPRGPRNLARPPRLLPVRDDADRGRLDGGQATAVARRRFTIPCGRRACSGAGRPTVTTD